MPKISDLELPKTVLVMGSSGSGKTRLCGTLCQLLPTFIITSDVNGLQTLQSMGVDTEYLYIDSWEKIGDYYGEIVRASEKYQAVAVDDYGAVQDAVEARITMQPSGWAEEELVRKKGVTAFRQQAIEGVLLGDRRLSTLSSHGSSWNQLSSALESFTSVILRLPFRVKLFTTLETVTMNPRTASEHIYPALVGQARMILPARFSLVAESFVATLDKSTYYCLSCRAHPRIETKTRYGDGGRTWTNPTMGKVLAYLNGKGEPETENEKKIGSGL